MQFEQYLSLSEPFNTPPEWLDSHLLITGCNNKYGQKLLRMIARNIYYNFREVGVLYLSPFDSRMKNRYPWDEYYYSPRLNPSTPYFHGSTTDEENVRKNVRVLSAALGFTDDFAEKFARYLIDKTLPPYLSQLLVQYETHVLETKEILGDDYLLLAAIQTTIKRNFDRHWKLTSEKIDWIERLRRGGKVFIDCSKYMTYKGWHITMLFQALRFHLCDGDAPHNKVLVITENANHTFHPIDVFHRSQYLLGDFQRKLLHEFARNNVYFFLEERCPSCFAHSIYPEIKRKIFFHHNYCNLREFSLTQEEYETIELKLPQGEAAVYCY